MTRSIVLTDFDRADLEQCLDDLRDARDLLYSIPNPTLAQVDRMCLIDERIADMGGSR